MQGTSVRTIPIEMFRIMKPADGFPPLMDWMTCMWSFLYSGVELAREPIDAKVPGTTSEADDGLYIIKGWTRLSVLCYIVLNIMGTDLSNSEALENLEAFDLVIKGCWWIPTNLSEVADKASLNAEHMLLSCRGSERQRPSILKLALRFEDSMDAKRQDPAVPAMPAERLLETLISEYNNHKSVAGIKKWQISEASQVAMKAIIFGTTVEVRELMRSHLNFNKWEHCCFTTDLLRCRRLFLNNKPSTGVPMWDLLLVVTPVSQKLLMMRMLTDFGRKAKKVPPEETLVNCRIALSILPHPHFIDAHAM